jgi:hypothetical protein
MAPARIFVATPCYGGVLHATYVAPLLDLCCALTPAGGRPIVRFLANESLIPRARNDCAAEFLKTECTHLLFIDADVGFRPEDVLHLVGSGLDVVAGVYPHKRINWPSLALAAASGTPVEGLPQAAAQFVVGLKEEDVARNHFPILDVRGQLYMEVRDAPTGFMCIRRQALTRLIDAFGDSIRYECADAGTRGEVRYDFFAAGPETDPDDPKKRRYLSEDYMFCRRWQKAGGKVYVFLGAQLSHTGPHTFVGSLEECFRGMIGPR